MEMRFYQISMLLLLSVPGHAYEFQYQVNRPREKLIFGHREAREGDLTSGDYRVLLPDGRTQVVEYRVEGEDTGYIVSVKYQGDPKEKDDPSSVRKREIVRQRSGQNQWKPYAREKPAVKSSEISKSAIKIISASEIEVIPEKTETTSIPVITTLASSQLFEAESIEPLPDLLLTTGIPQPVQDSISEPEVKPKIVNLSASNVIPTTENVVAVSYTGEEEWARKPREGLAHLDNHIAPSTSVLPDDEPTTILVSTRTPSTTATLMENNPSVEKEETKVDEKPIFWTPLASSRTSGSDLTKSHKTVPDSPKIKAEQLHATILKNVPIPARSSFVLEPSLSLQQRTPRLTSSFHVNARNSWGRPSVVFSHQQGDPRSTGAFRLKTQNSLSNPGMALHIPFPQTFSPETSGHTKQTTLPTSKFIHLSQYHAPLVNSRGAHSGRRIDGRTRLRSFPQFVTSYSNTRPGVRRPCKRNLRTRKKTSMAFSAPWYNLF